MMVVVWICFIHMLPLRGRWTQSGHIVPLLCQRITCISTIDISRSDVTPDLSRASIRCDFTFSQLYTPCSSETKDVITSKKTCSSIKTANISLGSTSTPNLNLHFPSFCAYHKNIRVCVREELKRRSLLPYCLGSSTVETIHIAQEVTLYIHSTDSVINRFLNTEVN
jgi:hypothetical protein